MACKSKKSDPCTCKSKKSDSNLKNLIFWYFFKSLYFYCCNLSGGVALIVWFTTNGMCAKNKNIYAWCKQAIIREIATHALYCCLLPWCEALLICHSGFPTAIADSRDPNQVPKKTLPYPYNTIICVTSNWPSTNTSGIEHFCTHKVFLKVFHVCTKFVEP